MNEIVYSWQDLMYKLLRIDDLIIKGHGDNRITVSLKEWDVYDGHGGYLQQYGDARTLEYAILDYIRKISGKQLKKMSGDRIVQILL